MKAEVDVINGRGMDLGRKYVDFWINLVDEVDMSEMLSEVRKLGFKSVVVSSTDNRRLEEFKKLGETIGVEVYSKLVLEPENRPELLKNLRTSRGKYEVISVICNNLEVALTAARDSRVDTVILPPGKKFRIDKGVAALINNSIELPFKWFIDEATRREFIRLASEVVNHLSKKKSIIVSSSASKPFQLRGPHELSSLLQVLGLDRATALDSVSTIPRKTIETNLVKLSPSYVARGVLKIG